MCDWSETNGKNGKNGMRSVKPLIHKDLPFSVFIPFFVPFSVPFGGVIGGGFCAVWVLCGAVPVLCGFISKQG